MESKLNYDDFELLTFDCYGTLIDWENGILGAVKPVLSEHGLAVADDQILETYAQIESEIEAGPYKPYHTVLREVMAKLSERFGFLPSAAELTTLLVSFPDWIPFDDTVGALKRLKSKYQLGIISNVDDDLFAVSNEHLQVEFDHIVTAAQVEAYKPSPVVFEKAIEKIGVPKQNILHVAQSLFHDHVPAQAFGLSTVWIDRRSNQPGAGATPPAEAVPHAEYPDLASLADAMGL